jgi:hypothetical protein
VAAELAPQPQRCQQCYRRKPLPEYVNAIKHIVLHLQDAMQASPHREIDLEPARAVMPVRDVLL